MLRYLLPMTLLGMPAFADVWDTFQSKCLVPLSTSALAQPTDMTAVAHYKNDGDTFSVYEVEGVMLSISDGRADQPRWCRVVAQSDAADAETVNAMLAWTDSDGFFDRFQQSNDFPGMLVFDSMPGQDPMIRVKMDSRAKLTGVALRAEEMN